MLHGEAAEVDDVDCAVDLSKLVHEDYVEEAGAGTEHVDLCVTFVGWVDGAWAQYEHPASLVVCAGQQYEKPVNREK